MKSDKKESLWDKLRPEPNGPEHDTANLTDQEAEEFRNDILDMMYPNDDPHSEDFEDGYDPSDDRHLEQ